MAHARNIYKFSRDGKVSAKFAIDSMEFCSKFNVSKLLNGGIMFVVSALMRLLFRFNNSNLINCPKVDALNDDMQLSRRSLCLRN